MPKASRPVRQMRQVAFEHLDPLDILLQAEELRERIPTELVLELLDKLGAREEGWGRCLNCSAPHTSKGRFCSSDCVSLFCSKRAAARRRAQKRGADGETENISLVELAKRDGFICHICREKVLPADASMDHLIPLSKGGTHTWANVALAHRRCNSKRGAGRLPAQLRLE